MREESILTQPIRAGGVTFGLMEAEVLPFEAATADFAHINDYLISNPAYQQHIIPDAMISSCSECCMAEINGKPNILGMLFRKSRAGKGCSQCPVSIASEKLPARDASGRILKTRDGQVLSCAGAVRMAEDGTA